MPLSRSEAAGGRNILNDTERLGRIASVFFNVGTIVHAELGREAKLEAHADADGTVVTVLMEGHKSVRLMFSIGEDNGVLVTDAASAAAGIGN